jgi:hypothetical protein
MSYSGSLTDHLKMAQTCRVMRRVACLPAANPSPNVLGFNRNYDYGWWLPRNATNRNYDYGWWLPRNATTSLVRAHVQAQLGQSQSSYWKGRVAVMPRPRDDYKHVLSGFRPRKLVLRWPFTVLLANPATSNAMDRIHHFIDEAKGVFPVHLLSPHLKELTIQVGDLDTGPTSLRLLEQNLLDCVGLTALTLTLVKCGPYNCGVTFFNGLLDAITYLPQKRLSLLTKLHINNFMAGTDTSRVVPRIAVKWPHLSNLRFTTNTRFVLMSHLHDLTTLDLSFPRHLLIRAFELDMEVMETPRLA